MNLKSKKTGDILQVRDVGQFDSEFMTSKRYEKEKRNENDFIFQFL